MLYNPLEVELLVPGFPEQRRFAMLSHVPFLTQPLGFPHSKQPPVTGPLQILSTFFGLPGKTQSNVPIDGAVDLR